MPKAFRLILCCAAASFFPSPDFAASVDFSERFLGGTRWQYNYSLVSSGPSSGLDELTVYFDRTLFSSLEAIYAPTGWDVMVAQPDLAIPADGFYDALLSTGSPLSSAPVDGFQVSFTYLGNGAPPPQPYDLIRSSDFTTLESGMTVQVAPAALPEPSTAWLMLLGLMVLSASKWTLKPRV